MLLINLSSFTFVYVIHGYWCWIIMWYFTVYHFLINYSVVDQFVVHATFFGINSDICVINSWICCLFVILVYPLWLVMTPWVNKFAISGVFGLLVCFVCASLFVNTIWLWIMNVVTCLVINYSVVHMVVIFVRNSAICGIFFCVRILRNFKSSLYPKNIV